MKDVNIQKKIIRVTEKDVILTISDLQFPFAHQDWFEFLKWVAKDFKVTLVINIGDEVDLNFLNYHEKDPEAMSANEEYNFAKKELKRLKSLFSKMFICWSNHGSLHLRKAKTAGMLSSWLKSPQDIWEVPGWSWHNEIEVHQEGRTPILFVHNLSGSCLNNAKARGCSVVQGHFHSKFELLFYKTHNNLIAFGATIGCLIDREKYVFNYAKQQKDMQQLGVLVIKNGVPTMVPMIVDKNNRWIGRK